MIIAVLVLSIVMLIQWIYQWSMAKRLEGVQWSLEDLRAQVSDIQNPKS
jgi:hypothetical protein